MIFFWHSCDKENTCFQQSKKDNGKFKFTEFENDRIGTWEYVCEINIFMYFLQGLKFI